MNLIFTPRYFHSAVAAQIVKHPVACQRGLWTFRSQQALKKIQFLRCRVTCFSASCWSSKERAGGHGCLLSAVCCLPLLRNASVCDNHRSREQQQRHESNRPLGVWAAEEASAAKCPQRPIFRRLSAKYLDIRRRKRQKLSSLGPLFASTPSAAQTPSPSNTCASSYLFDSGRSALLTGAEVACLIGLRFSSSPM